MQNEKHAMGLMNFCFQDQFKNNAGRRKKFMESIKRYLGSGGNRSAACELHEEGRDC